MGNLRGAFIIAAAAYCIIFCSSFIQPGLSLINPADVVVKRAAERQNTPNLATKSSAPAEEEEKRKPAADAGHLLVDPKHKPATDQAKHLSSPPPAADKKDDSRPDDQSKSKPKTAHAEQHKHQHKHKKKKDKKQDRSTKLKPKSETKTDVSPSPSPLPKRSASPKQARESSSPKRITTAPTKATKKLDDQPSKKTPKLSSSSATTHEKPAKAPASPKHEWLPSAARLSTLKI